MFQNSQFSVCAACSTSFRETDSFRAMRCFAATSALLGESVEREDLAPDVLLGLLLGVDHDALRRRLRRQPLLHERLLAPPERRSLLGRAPPDRRRGNALGLGLQTTCGALRPDHR